MKPDSINHCLQCKKYTFTQNWYVRKIKRHLPLSKSEIAKTVGLKIWTNDTVYSPHMILKGDLIYLIWWEDLNDYQIELCSRDCAINYSISNNKVLYKFFGVHKDSGAMYVTPYQEEIDLYRKNKNIVPKIGVGDNGFYETDDLNFLLNQKKIFPFQIKALAIEYIYKGDSDLAFKAADRLIKEYFLDPAIVGATAEIFYFLHDNKHLKEIFYLFIDPFLSKLNADILSNWSFLLLQADKIKALHLSHLAVSKSTSLYGMVGNHLNALMANNKFSEALEFINSKLSDLVLVVDYYNAGLVCYHNFLYTKAIYFLEIANSIHSDTDILCLLSVSYYRLNDYNTSIRYANLGLQILNVDLTETFKGADNNNIIHYGLLRDENLMYNRNLKLLQGLCHIKKENFSFGQTIVLDALKIEIAAVGDYGLIEEARKLFPDFKNRQSLQLENNSLAISNTELNSKVYALGKKINTLNELLTRISTVYNEWSDTLLSLTNEIINDEVDKNFSSKIHSLVCFLKSFEQQEYDKLIKTNSQRYNSLSMLVHTNYCNGLFLLSKSFKQLNDETPIYASAIIEFSKAIEIAVNEKIIHPFFRFLISASPSSYLINIDGINLFLFTSKERKEFSDLMLKDCSQLLASKNNEWLTFVNKSEYNIWIRSTLPNLLMDIKDNYRNGCAHKSLATKKKVKKLLFLIESQKMIENLNSISF